MKISEVYDENIKDYEMLMSNLDLQYTWLNKCGESGYLNLDYETGPLCFEIDWSSACTTYVSDLKKYNQEFEIKGWDSDDNCYVEFEHIVHDHNNKKVILV